MQDWEMRNQVHFMNRTEKKQAEHCCIILRYLTDTYKSKFK